MLHQTRLIRNFFQANILALSCALLLLSCTTASAQELTLDNADVVLHRTAQLKYENLSEGQAYARQLVNTINSGNKGLVRAIMYEEQFGQHFRLHWLILFKDLESYHTLRSNLMKDSDFLSISAESVWGSFFVQSSIQDELIVRDKG